MTGAEQSDGAHHVPDPNGVVFRFGWSSLEDLHAGACRGCAMRGPEKRRWAGWKEKGASLVDTEDLAVGFLHFLELAQEVPAAGSWELALQRSLSRGGKGERGRERTRTSPWRGRRRAPTPSCGTPAARAPFPRASYVRRRGTACSAPGCARPASSHSEPP